MKVYVIVKDTPDYSQDIAHLYEHWFIMSFYKYAFDVAGMHGGTIGYIGGETYNNIIFIEAWFYDDRAAKLFEQFQADEKLAPELLDMCMRQCQAEDRVVWDVHDRALLDKQLTSLRTKAWQDAENIKPYIYDDGADNDNLPIAIQKAAARYKAVTIVANMAGASVEDQAVFQRLYVIISDIIGQFIQQKGWHTLDTFTPHQNKDGIYTIVGVSLPRGELSNNGLRESVTAYLRQFDISTNMPLIRAHFAEFVQQPLWKGRMRDVLHDVDVVSSNRSITKLATEKRVSRILQSLTISVHTESYTFAKNIPY